MANNKRMKEKRRKGLAGAFAVLLGIRRRLNGGVTYTPRKRENSMQPDSHADLFCMTVRACQFTL